MIQSQPLNIVHYVPIISIAEGGVARAILDWCSVLAGRGHRMTLIVRQPGDIPPDWLNHAANSNPRAIVVPAPRHPGGPINPTAIKLANEAVTTADVLHLHGPWLPGNRQFAGLARLRGVPYVVSTHGFLDNWSMQQRFLKKKLYMILFGRRFMNNAAAIHCTAPAELDQANKWFTNPRTTVLPCLTDLSPFEHLPGPDSALTLLPSHQATLPKILFLSRLHEKKGVDILIRAAAQLRDAGQSFVLLIAGTGEAAYKRQLLDLTAKLNLTDHVHFLGLITGSQKLSLYQLADIFVLPTFQENFGLVLAEALACGTPVITTRGTDLWPHIQEAGGLITDATPAAFAAAISTLLASPDDLPALGRRGRAWVFDNLAQDTIARRYETLYRELAHPRATTP